MSRPTSESINPAPSFGASPDTTFGNIEVSPLHSLDVDGATENARMLANLFAKGADIADTVIKQKQSDADAQGYLDGSVGAVNVGPSGSTITAGAYAAGAHRAQVQMTAVDAAGKAKQFFAAHPDMPLMDSTDKDGNTIPGLMTSIDGIWKQAFPGGAETDPVTARLIAPLVQHTYNEIAGASYQASIQKTQQSAEDAATALATHDAANPGGGLFDPKASLDTLTKVYGGDARLGRDALVKSVGEAAVQSGDPTLITKYLPSGFDLGGGATLTPDNLAYLDGAKNRATAAQNKNNAAALNSAGMDVVQAVVAGRDPMAALNNYMTKPNASPEFARSMLDWVRGQGSEKASRALDTTDAAQLQSEIALGKVTTLEQAQQEVAQKGYTAGAAVQLVTHAASWLDAKHTTDERDPQFVAARDALDQIYRPGINPLTGQFTKPQDVQTHANVLSDFITQYQQRVNQGNVSAADAAHQASDFVQKKYPSPTATDAAAATRLPTSDAERASYLRNSANMNADGFNRAGITPTVIKRLRDANQLDSDTAAAALKTWLATNQGIH